MVKKFIPDFYYNSIYDIPLEEWKKNGVRLILTDLDNTLISYNESMPNDELFKFKDKVLNLGIEFILVSNSRKERVENFSKALGIPCVKFSTKPLKRGILKAIHKVAHGCYTNDQVVLLGDQIMTDIFGGNRVGIKTCLIKAIDKSSDTLPTRINRNFEKKAIMMVKKKYEEDYNLVLKDYFEEIYDNKKM
jgi:HAD superfamily phosphatase (TIGR01668 family)